MMQYKRFLVCGGREFADLSIGREDVRWSERERQYRYVFNTLYSWIPTPTAEIKTWLPPEDVVIISGMAKGADTAAVEWAVVNYVKVEEFPADWARYGKSAGYKRNVQMLKEGKPDIVLAFPGGKGTAMMEEIAAKASIPVFRYSYND